MHGTRVFFNVYLPIHDILSYYEFEIYNDEIIANVP